MFSESKWLFLKKNCKEMSWWQTSDVASSKFLAAYTKYCTINTTYNKKALL